MYFKMINFQETKKANPNLKQCPLPLPQPSPESNDKKMIYSDSEEEPLLQNKPHQLKKPRITAKKEKSIILGLLKILRPDYLHLFLGILFSILFGMVTPINSILFGEVMHLLEADHEKISQLTDNYTQFFICLSLLSGFLAFSQVINLIHL